MSSVLFPGFASSPHTAAQQHATSQDSLLAALGRFARHPASSLHRLAHDLSSPLSARLLGPDARRRAILTVNLKEAVTYAEWRDAAAGLDELEGHNEWKQTLETNEYDYRLVQTHLNELEAARRSCDPHRMLFLLRTSLTRHLGNMGDVRLYKHSRIGTKALIEKYIETTLDTLANLLDVTRNASFSDLDPRHLLDQVLQTRQAFGRSALLLSGGGTFGMNHIGVVKCLWDNKLLPRIISGASAGSIVSSVLCTRTDPEIPQVMADFCFGDLEVFTRGDEEQLTKQLARFLKHGSLFDSANLQRVMRDMLGDMTFQEAYNRTRRILNICVSSASVYELPRLLNYITAPNVVIWSAVLSSCSVPLVFSPAPLLAKDPRTGEMLDWNPSTQCWIDGSVENDLPMTRLAELFNVNHFIVSQVNPHVVPFLDSEEGGPVNSNTEPGQHPGPGWLHAVADVAKDEAMHRMQFMIELGIFPTLLTKTRSILSQKYSGDITILPKVSYAQFPNVLRNPTSEFMVRAQLAGERATWPKLSRVQNHCAIELALDDAVQQLRARVAFSPSQINLRRLHEMEKPSINRSATAGVKSRQRKGGLKQSKSFGPMYGGAALTPSASNDSSATSPPGDNTPRAGRPSLRVRRSFRHSLKTSSPDNMASEEEKMFSTTPIDSTDDEETGGYDDSEDTAEDGYFALSPQHEEDLPTKLFPHASQPASPLYHRRRSSSSTQRPPTPRQQSGLTSTLAMTSTPSPTSGRRSGEYADISGTRGMMMRKRRSVASIPQMQGDSDA